MSVIDQCVSSCAQDNLELGCMSIFGNGSQRYPAALLEPLHPKPGGLRNEQLLVYEAFQRIPRHPNIGASQQQTGGTTPESSAGGIGPVSNTGVPGKGGAKINVQVLSSIAMKLNNAVTSLLGAAGPRASEVTLRMLPPDHEIKQLLGTLEQVT